MGEIQNFSIQIHFNPLWFWIGFVLLVLYSVYAYKFTVPQVSKPFKFFLIFLRVSALLLILFAIFEPALNYDKIKTIEKKNYIFVDNSSSIVLKDSSENFAKVNSSIDELQNNLNGAAEILTFGNEIKNFGKRSPDSLMFSGVISNYAKIIDYLKQSEINAASVVLIGDGIITDGVNPLYSAAKLNVPFFTIGVGDTTERKDIEIGSVLFNKFVYAGNETIIKADILNDGFAGENITAVLKENDIVISRKNLELKGESFNSLEFNYTPDESGDKKLMIQISNAENEFSYANNSKSFFLKVLDSKVNILVVSGSPSPDLSFILRTLERNDNFSVKRLLQINETDFLQNKNNIESLIDSASIFVFAGFPSSETSGRLSARILESIDIQNKSLFFILSAGTDLNKLKMFDAHLPFAIGKISGSSLKAQPWDIESSNPIVKFGESAEEFWTNLPPVERSSSEITTKPGSSILAKAKTNNVETEYPLLVSNKTGAQRSVAILAKNIWKWKLQTSSTKNIFFESFINAVIKWLNADEDYDKINVNTSKQIYSLGETIQFNSQIYDESFNPVNNAEVRVEIKTDKEIFDLILSPSQAGIYEGNFETNLTGDFSYKAEVYLDEDLLGSDEGKFNIGDVEAEALDLRMNNNFLSLLASETGGEFSFAENISEVIPKINDIFENIKEERIEKKEIVLWSNEWLLIISIFLLSLEWFLRKRAGML